MLKINNRPTLIQFVSSLIREWRVSRLIASPDARSAHRQLAKQGYALARGQCTPHRLVWVNGASRVTLE